MTQVFFAILPILALLALVLPNPGQADVPARLNTAIPAAAVIPSPFIASEQIPVAAGADKIPTANVTLTLPLNALRRNSQLQVCAIRLVMVENVPAGTDNGMLLELLQTFEPQDGKPSRTVASIVVPPGKPAGTAIILRSKALCDGLQPLVRDGAAEARYLLQTTIRNGKVTIYGAASSADSDPSRVPRLMVTYQRPDALPGDADWTQIRRDAQRSGRSPWKLYDPDGTYAPTEFQAVPLSDSGPEAKVRGDVAQSPLLLNGRIIAALPAPQNTSQRVAAFARSGRIVNNTDLPDLPKFLAGGSTGSVLYVAEDKIYALDRTTLAWTVSGIELPPQETILESPTIGADGTVYLVTSENVRAFTQTGVELWRYGKPGVGAASTISLGTDETTAYIILGGDTNARLVALDSATGECRAAVGIGQPITRSQDGDMPIPVVAGTDVLFTTSFPTSDRLHIFHDLRPGPVDVDQPQPRSELVKPLGAGLDACRTTPGAASVSIRGEVTDHIPTPVAGVSEDAYYIRGGKLCWSRTDDAPAEQCTIPVGCSEAEMRTITLLIGDSNPTNMHLYGLSAEQQRLVFMTVRWTGDRGFEASCRTQGFPGLGPNLVLGRDGTLYNVGNDGTLRAIVPKSFAGQTADLTLSSDLLTSNNDTTLRAGGTILAPANLTLPSSTNLNLVAGKGISFAPGFRVATGARLRARAGF